MYSKYNFYAYNGSSIVLLLIVLFISCVTYSQVISGSIKNLNNVPLDYVTVSIKEKNHVVATSLSDSLGNYKLAIKLPSRFLNISFSRIGYFPLDTIVTATNFINLDIVLKQNPKELKEVIVSSKKPLVERKVDRFVFNIEDNVNTVGLDVFELLSKTPMVSTGRGDEISITGKGLVIVMIDDRIQKIPIETLIQILKSMSAGSISKIEIITNPPSQYDAEGNSGIINIVTRKIKKLGYYASVNSTLSKATFWGNNDGLNINFNTKKIQWVANVNAGVGSTAPYNVLEKYYTDRTYKQMDNENQHSRLLRGSLGFEKPLSTNTTFGAAVYASVAHPNTIGINSTVITNTQGSVDSIILARNLYNTQMNNISANIHLDHHFDTTGKKLVIDADWFSNSIQRSMNFSDSNYYANGNLIQGSSLYYLSGNNSASTAYTLNAVATIPQKKYECNFGFKLSFIRNTANAGLGQFINSVYIPDPKYTDDFIYNENTQAVFGNISRTIKKWQFQLGLRAENTELKGHSIALNQVNSQHYLGIFPTTYVTYQLNDNNTLSLNYGRRISRPTYQTLNPFRTYYDLYSYWDGNPALKPSYSNNFELSETFHGFIIFDAYYDFMFKSMAFNPHLSDTTNISSSTLQNSQDKKDLGFSTSISLMKWKWFQSQNEIDVYYSRTRSFDSATLPLVKGWGGQFATSNTIYFNKSRTIAVNIDYRYQFPQVVNLTKFQAYQYLGLTAKFITLKKKLQIGIDAMDIFKTKIVSGYIISNGIKSVTTSNNDSRRVILSFRYNFGSTKIKIGHLHSENSEEQGRAN